MQELGPRVEQEQRPLHQPIYDPNKDYYFNYKHGPFGKYADGEKYEQEGDPKHLFLGHEVYFPFGIAAGPLINGNFVKAALDKGYDIVTYKTVRSKLYKAHPHPNILAVHPEGQLDPDAGIVNLTADRNYQRPLGITNSFGVPSMDPEVWQQDMASCIEYAGKGQLVIASIQGTVGERDYLGDFAKTARLASQTGAKVIEINGSCPNEGTSNLLCFDPQMSRKMLERVREEVGYDTKIIFKVAYMPPFMVESLVSQTADYVDAYSTINTLPANVYKDEKSKRAALPSSKKGKNDRLISGVCGSPIRDAGLMAVDHFRQIRDWTGRNFEIVGVGGVSSPYDFELYKDMGADVVMCATEAIYNPYFAQEIKATQP